MRERNRTIPRGWASSGSPIKIHTTVSTMSPYDANALAQVPSARGGPARRRVEPTRAPTGAVCVLDRGRTPTNYMYTTLIKPNGKQSLEPGTYLCSLLENINQVHAPRAGRRAACGRARRSYNIFSGATGARGAGAGTAEAMAEVWRRPYLSIRPDPPAPRPPQTVPGPGPARAHPQLPCSKETEPARGHA